MSVLLNAQMNDTVNCHFRDPKGRIREHNMDFISLLLNVSFIPEQGEVIGRAEYTFSALQQTADSVFLDGPGILVKNIDVDQKACRFRVDSAGITVFFDPPLHWDDQHNMVIDYTAYPRKGIYFYGWDRTITAPADDPDRLRKQIWTQGQGIDNRNWIPSYDDVDDKLQTELMITFDKKYTVISNGTLVHATENRDGSKTWDYAMQKPMAPYLIMIAIGDYAYQDFTSQNGITTRDYYYPDRADAVATTYAEAAQMMDWIQQETGVAFPWQSYANVPVEDFMYGAMENTTATIYTDYYLQNEHEVYDQDYVAVAAHELTHQWFGDYVTEYSAANHWLHESFATYYSKKFRQSIYGDDAYEWIRQQEILSAFDADNKNLYPIGYSGGAYGKIYTKGSLVLDMLRDVVGDEQFRRVIHDYLLAHPYANVETHDFQMQFMKTLGMNLDWFFDEWVYKGGYPEYDVAYHRDNDTVIVHIKQVQKITETTGLFKMPVHVQVHFTDGSYTDRMIWVENAETELRVPVEHAREVAFVLFDPGMKIYARVDFRRSYKELRYQAFNAPNMIDRYEAVSAMHDESLDTKRDDLIALYNKETFYGIKGEILSQLASDDDKNSLEILRNAMHDPDRHIREALVNAYTYVPEKLEKDYVSLLSDPNYNIVASALHELCETFPAKRNQYLAATKNTMGQNKAVRCLWLYYTNLGNHNKDVAELIGYSSFNYEFRTRINAMQSLEALQYCDSTVARNLLDAMLSENYHLSGTAVGVLKFYLRNVPAGGDIIRAVYKESHWEPWQEEKLSPLLGAPSEK